jgi:hypothetical protein
MRDDFPATTPTSNAGAGQLLGSRTSYLLGACALAATSYALGASWLGDTTLGLPIGVWIVVGGLGCMEYASRQTGAVPRDARLRLPVLPALLRGEFRRLSLAGAPPWATDAVELVRQVLTIPFGMSPRSRASGLADRAVTHRTGARLRLGLEMSRRHADVLTESLLMRLAPDVSLEVTRIRADRQGGDPARLGLDAIVRSGPFASARPGQFSILLPEHPSHPAAWTDWDSPRPLSYPSVFPARIDPARVSCGGLDLSDERQARLLARLVEAAALLGRSEVRRRSPSRFSPRARMGGLDAPGGPLELVMMRLAQTLRIDWSDDATDAPGACSAAARAVGAWLTTVEIDAADADDRQRCVELASRILGGETEALLQVGAARIGAYADTEALGTLTQAFRQLVGSDGGVPDPLPFILSELELGPPGPLTLGRIAAGLALLWAASSHEHLAYLRDDLTEEMRYAARFVGNDPDHRLLLEVIATLDRLRTGARHVRLGRAA